MSLTKLAKDLSVISKLSDEPNDADGLTADELKAKFDEAGNSIKDYLNSTLTPELDTAIEEIGEAAAESYKKPDTGIPKTDLASGVQNSLSKADTALQDGALPTGGTEGDVLVKSGDTDYAATWKKPQYCRPNLLENWYFRGGGSQQGAGHFPINQRGQAIYDTEGITIDRWKISANSYLVVQGSALNFHYIVPGVTSMFSQRLSALHGDLYGKTLTATLLFTNGTILTGSYTLTAARPSSGVSYYDFLCNELPYYYGKISLGVAASGRLFFAYTFTSQPYSGLLAAKLEIGDFQTLTHTAGTAQALNTIPEWSEEQRKCLRYYVSMYCVMQYATPNFLTGNGTFPVPMAATPTVTVDSVQAISGFVPEASTYVLNTDNLSLRGVNAATDVFTIALPYYVHLTAKCE